MTTTGTVSPRLGNQFTIANRRYIGGKSLLIEKIFGLIPSEIPRDTFCDIFAGTGVVGAHAVGKFGRVIFNDLLYSNEMIYKGFYGSGGYSITKLEDFVEFATRESKEDVDSNYFRRHFGGKYFSNLAARQIGFIRELIEGSDFDLNERERSILIASLIYSADRVANTVGHYEAYRLNPSNFKELDFRLINPTQNSSTEIYREDANDLARKIVSDVVYVDPPYNSRQYSRFYHLLETLTKWDKPALEGVALKPPTENTSNYCKVAARDTFADLIQNIDAKLIIASYNNTYESKSSSSRNKITLDQITEIMSAKGKTYIHAETHKYFSAGNTDFSNHLEYLFVTQVGV